MTCHVHTEGGLLDWGLFAQALTNTGAASEIPHDVFLTRCGERVKKGCCVNCDEYFRLYEEREAVREAARVVDAGSESVLQEAHRLTHGPRKEAYGHPLDDYSRNAALFSQLVAHKLKAPLTAHDAALFMCCVKLSRQSHAPKRDNMVDLAGYAWVANACLEETERRKNAAQS